MEAISRQDIDFLLYQWLDVARLARMPAFSDQSRADWDAVLDLFAALARQEFLPLYKAGDTHEPRLEQGVVRVYPPLKAALRTCLDNVLA